MLLFTQTFVLNLLFHCTVLEYIDNPFLYIIGNLCTVGESCVLYLGIPLYRVVGNPLY
jgi:hypothetical protein